MLFILAYRPPIGDVSHFICNISPLLKAATSNYKKICSLGDFNMRNIDWSDYSANSEYSNSFCNMITENSLFQMNDIISNKHGSLLDLMFTIEPYLVDEPVECPIEFATASTLINEAWSIWSSTVTEHINQCIPRVPVKNSSKHPWMDGEIRYMHNCKHTAWVAAERTNNVKMWNKFRCLQNKIKQMLRDKRSSLLSDLALSLKNNAKRFWEFWRLNL